MKKVISFLFVFFISLAGYSQCAMCKATAESNANGGGSMAAGLNAGIIYLMFIPYLLIGILVFLFYRHRKKNKTANGA